MERRLALLVATVAFIFSLPSPVHSAATANVTLSSIAFAKQFSWFMKPRFFIQCGARERTYLTKVTKAGFIVAFTGGEEWQPVAELQLDDCVACHVGEQMWFEYHVHASWMVCERNFSRDPRRRFDPLAHLHLVAPQEEAVVDLSCAECARDAEVEPEAQAPSSPSSPGLGPFFWVFASATILGVSIFVIAFVAFLSKGPQTALDDNERQKFIEMNASHDPERLAREREEGERWREDEEEEMVQIVHEPRESKHFSDILREDRDRLV